jgi:hypothetical protein
MVAYPVLGQQVRISFALHPSLMIMAALLPVVVQGL